jgi:hypothetical protein
MSDIDTLFIERRAEILAIIKAPEYAPGAALQNIIDLQTFVNNSASTLFLPKSKIKFYQQEINSLSKMINSANDINPKKKFSFKRTLQNPVITAISDAHVPPVESVAAIQTTESHFSNALSITNLTNRIIIPSGEKTDIIIENLSGCIVILSHMIPTSLFLKNITNSLVVSHFISGSLYVESVSNCHISGSVCQLRIHLTTKSYFHTKVSSNAIIEDSNQLNFCKYPFDVDSELPKIDDFNWLQKSESPNFSYTDYDYNWDLLNGLNVDIDACKIAKLLESFSIQ